MPPNLQNGFRVAVSPLVHPRAGESIYGNDGGTTATTLTTATFDEANFQWRRLKQSHRRSGGLPDGVDVLSRPTSGRLPLPSTMPSSDSYLIVGGGLLGGHIVDLLLQRGEKAVAVFDLNPSSFDSPVKVYQGDIADPDAVGKAIKAVGSAFLTALPLISLPATVTCPVKSYLYHSDRGSTSRAAPVRSRQSQHRRHEERHRTSPKIRRSEIRLDELGERSFRR